MGDSFLAGAGNPGAQNCPGSSTPGANAAYWSSPNIVADKYADAMTMTNLACSGATTEDLIKRPTGQIDQIPNDADLVIVMVGGNDVDFAGILGDCLYFPPLDAKCDDLRGYFDQGLANLRIRLPFVYKRIKEGRNPAMKIFTITYPVLVGGGTACPSWLSEDEQIFVRYAQGRLNGVVRDVATAAGAHLVEGLDTRDDARNDEFWDRDLCSNGFSHFYEVSPIEYFLTAPAHPTIEGQEEIAKRLGETIRAHAPELLVPVGSSALPPPPSGTYRVTASAGLSVRSGPGTTYPAVGLLAYGTAVPIHCQTLGQTVNGSEIWDAVPGGFVSDYFMSTPGIGVFSPGIPNCSSAGALPPPQGGVPTCSPNPQANAFVEGLAGDDGWVRSNPTITISGLDLNGCGGVDLESSLDGGPWVGYSGPFGVNGDGVHQLRYRAKGGGVTSSERSVEVKIDTVPPKVGNPTITAPIDINNIIRDEATLTVPWTDATSGVRWVKRRCGSDPFTEHAGGTATWMLAGAGVTACDTYARDVAGWEAARWNSGPLIFNRLTFDASEMLTIDSATGTTVFGQTRAHNFKAISNTGTTVDLPVWLTGTGPVAVSNNTNSRFATTPSPVPIPRLNYPIGFYKARSIVMEGPLVIDNVDTPLPPYCIYVNGDIFIYAVHLDSKACLIAEGDIIDESTATTWTSGDPANGLLMMAGHDMTVTSTGNTNLGLLYAPDGTINFDGTTGLDSKGSAVAKNIVLDGVTNTKFSYAAGFAPTTRPLPLASPFIPLPPTMPTPGTPAPTSPANDATGVKVTQCLSWDGPAPGFEVQLASAATFAEAEVVRTGSAIEDVWCPEENLPASTKLFWRVRAMGLAGHASPWSAARSFTTKAPDPTLSVNDVSVTEGNSGTRTAQVTVTRSGPTSGTSSVKVATSNGSASAPSDYTALPSTTLTFAPGDTAKPVTVTIAGDTAVEPDEAFSLRLSSPTGSVITDDSGNVTITNDDVPAAQATLAINDISLTEGDYGMQNALFTVSRAGPAMGTSTVRYQTRNGSADAGSDYVAVPATTLTFNVGETSKTVSVMVNGDTVVEGHETFKVDLSSATGATIADDSGIATIRNNDASLSINDIEVDEGDSSPRTGTFTVTRTGATDGTSWVMYATVNGTATAPSDYTALYGAMLMFSPGETSRTISVTVVGDRIDESDETFRVTLSNPSGATISDGSGTVEIDDND